eukprot:scaffold3740_cov322-Prasinococcus_capsulatus_cf.AAC.16
MATRPLERRGPGIGAASARILRARGYKGTRGGGGLAHLFCAVGPLAGSGVVIALGAVTFTHCLGPLPRQGHHQQPRPAAESAPRRPWVCLWAGCDAPAAVRAHGGGASAAGGVPDRRAARGSRVSRDMSPSGGPVCLVAGGAAARQCIHWPQVPARALLRTGGRRIGVWARLQSAHDLRAAPSRGRARICVPCRHTGGNSRHAWRDCKSRFRCGSSSGGGGGGSSNRGNDGEEPEAAHMWYGDPTEGTWCRLAMSSPRRDRVG